jgi:exodeoxyribonuclease V alpha subunit
MWEREYLNGAPADSIPDGPWVESVQAGLPALKGPVCCWNGRRSWIHEWNWQAQLARVLRPAQIQLLVGGPGTGKSTRAAQIIQAADQVTVTAPTGKAVSRLQQLLNKEGVRCATLHSLLGARLDGTLTRPHACVTEDLVVVDESSMVDGPMMAALVGSLGPETRLLLVGDPDQLPPIGQGSPFQELVASNLFPCERLTRIHRTDNIELQKLAAAIRDGLPVQAAPLPPPGPWLLDLHRQGYQILTALRQGPYGTDAINALFSEPTTPICITRNCPDLDLYNGDMGRLAQGVAYFDNGLTLSQSQLPPYTPAYALSIHRAQGSEWSKVAVLLPPGSDSFSRNLLYTAITRARTDLQLFASPNVMDALLQPIPSRPSMLIDQLRHMWGQDERPTNLLSTLSRADSLSLLPIDVLDDL